MPIYLKYKRVKRSLERNPYWIMFLVDTKSGLE